MLDFFRRFSKSEIHSSAAAQAKELTDQLREASKRGDKNAVKDLVSDALVPKDAVSLNGYFSDEVKLAIRSFDSTRDSKKLADTLNKLLLMMQDFYGDMSMAIWVFHQACLQDDIKESLEESCIGEGLAKMRDPQNKKWVSLGYKQFVIEWVEAKYGPMSCTKERYWQSIKSDAVERLYKASLGEMSRSERIAFANNLMCIDHPNDLQQG